MLTQIGELDEYNYNDIGTGAVQVNTEINGFTVSQMFVVACPYILILLIAFE